ncbi:MAG: hypothetical protein Kow0037_31990 [Calditrichia bacterium]
MEHEHPGDLIKRIRQPGQDFTVPGDACNTFRVCYQKLREFETDLFQHIHLENNVLFPKTLLLVESGGRLAF